MLFTVLALGHVPRLASESSDSGQDRLGKIVELIRASRLSIHDLSRIKSSTPGEFARFNLPFELGVDHGARKFGGRSLRSKRCLILEREPYDYQRAISDLSGMDIKSHSNEPSKVVRAIREWFVETVGLRNAAGASRIFSRFTDFESDLYDRRMADGFTDLDIHSMPVPEYIDAIGEWLRI